MRYKNSVIFKKNSRNKTFLWSNKFSLKNKQILWQTPGSKLWIETLKIISQNWTRPSDRFKSSTKKLETESKKCFNFPINFMHKTTRYKWKKFKWDKNCKNLILIGKINSNKLSKIIKPNFNHVKGKNNIWDPNLKNKCNKSQNFKPIKETL